VKNFRRPVAGTNASRRLPVLREELDSMPEIDRTIGQNALHIK
jgi:hypothetical protein